MPDSLTTWGQLAFFAVASACGIVWAVSHLFKAMTSTYGDIIKALQLQNADQQKQITALGATVGALREAQVNTNVKTDKLVTESTLLKETVQAVAAKVNGG